MHDCYEPEKTRVSVCTCVCVNVCECLTGVHQSGGLQDDEGLEVGGRLPSLLLPPQGQEGR